MRTRFAGMTDVGLMREHNEDNLLVMPDYHVVAVADGMGGHRSGDVASRLAVSTLSDFFAVTVGRDGTWPFAADPNLTEEENYIVTGLRLANRRIFDRSLKTMADFGMGTTIVTAMFDKTATRVTIGHVGDSRCYRIRGETITQLTRDHSLVSDAQYMAPWMTEEEIRRLPPNVITRALGIREDVVVDRTTEYTDMGDIYLLCSDGLSGLVKDPEIRDIVLNAAALDALYGETATFDGWVRGNVARFTPPATTGFRFVDVYTASGGTMANARAMAGRAATWLRTAGLTASLLDDDTVTMLAPEDYAHPVIFKRSALSHDDTTRYYPRRLFAASGFAPLP
jgi:protein phosphatase